MRLALHKGTETSYVSQFYNPEAERSGIIYGITPVTLIVKSLLGRNLHHLELKHLTRILLITQTHKLLHGEDENCFHKVTDIFGFDKRYLSMI